MIIWMIRLWHALQSNGLIKFSRLAKITMFEEVDVEMLISFLIEQHKYSKYVI
jgi:hypothetical protein